MSPNNGMLIRGDAATQAKAIDLVRQSFVTGATTTSAVDANNPIVGAVGPWAQELEEMREEARRTGFESGRNEGLALGLQEGRQQMQNQTEERLAELAATVDQVLAGLEERNEEVCHSLSDQVADLALEIAEAVLAREVQTSIDPGADAITRCLELAPATGDVVARLHPADLAQLGQVTAIADRKLTVTADPTLQRGDAVVSVDDATIDARLSESLRRVAEALR